MGFRRTVPLNQNRVSFPLLQSLRFSSRLLFNPTPPSPPILLFKLAFKTKNPGTAGLMNPRLLSTGEPLASGTRMLSAIPSPSLVGTDGDCQTGSSPGSGSSLVRPSQEIPSGIYGLAPHYSGGTASASHRTSLLSPLGTPAPLIYIFLSQL